MIKKFNKISFAISAVLLSLSANANTEDRVDIKAGFAVDMGFGVTALIDNQFSIMLGNNGIAGDYLFRRGEFNADVPFTWYVAGGAYAEWDDGFGVRLPLGLNLSFDGYWDGDAQTFGGNWNAYAQIAPDIDFDDNDDNVKFGTQLAAGLRYSF